MKFFNILAAPFLAVYNICKWYFHLYRASAWYLKTILALASFIILMVTYILMVNFNFLFLFGNSPSIREIKNPPRHIASEIYSADGVMIGKFYNENRSPVSYNAVTPEFWKALIDTEDERFYQHNGIDYGAMLAAVKDAILRQKPRGASTITQQLAKNLFRTRTRHSAGPLAKVPGLGLLITKTKEWIVAYKLENIYTKQEILLLYANTVEFGGNLYGIKTAAKAYFDKTPTQLTTEECAVLVGMLKAITTYNPRINPQRSLQRRNTVLSLMQQHGHLTKHELDSISNIPINLTAASEQKLAGLAPYFREALAKELQEWCQEEGIDLYNDGLKIYTTIDTRMQKYAEQAVLQHMKTLQNTFDKETNRLSYIKEEPNLITKIAQQLPLYQKLSAKYNGNPDSINHHLNSTHKVKVFSYDTPSNVQEKQLSTLDSIQYMVNFLHCSFVAIEPATGYVRAYIGDVDYNTWQYDKAQAMRQPGSTFKLFVYTEAMNQGLTPCDKRRDEYFQATIWDKKLHKEVVWTPNNANRRFSGDSLTLKTAFAQSVNSVAVRLGQELSVERIAETATQMGIESKLDPTPALALGASDVTLLELTNAYATIAAAGKHTRRVFVTKIINADGKQIYTDNQAPKPVLTPLTAYYMQQLLKAGLQEANGTSKAMLQYIGHITDTDFGGKTGTTNNNSDGWYISVTPNIVCGAWVGGEYRSIHFQSTASGQGSRTALPICGLFMRKLMGDRTFLKYHAHFNINPDIDEEQLITSCDDIVTHQPQDTIPEEYDSLNIQNTPYHQEHGIYQEEQPITDYQEY
ncbi:MAG: transglycosylase domain-containing protein [Bacteroidaceae bacterium]|nr:transglycosylase domain-containing protein [Bacteroidaceae bacterium]